MTWSVSSWGLVLLTAAGLKGHQLLTEPVLGNGLLHTRWVLIGLVELELLSGVGAVCAATLLLTLTLAARGSDAASDDPKSLVREAFLAARDG